MFVPEDWDRPTASRRGGAVSYYQPMRRTVFDAEAASQALAPTNGFVKSGIHNDLSTGGRTLSSDDSSTHRGAVGIAASGGALATSNGTHAGYAGASGAVSFQGSAEPTPLSRASDTSVASYQRAVNGASFGPSDCGYPGAANTVSTSADISRFGAGFTSTNAAGNKLDEAAIPNAASRPPSTSPTYSSGDAGPPPWPEQSGRRTASPLQRPSTPPQIRPSATSEVPPAPAAALPNVEVRGDGEIPGPWRSWSDVIFPASLKDPLLAAGFPAPSSIQAYAWPICALGRDMIGIAKTGSGKTLAFLLPAFAMILAESRASTGGLGGYRSSMGGPPAILVLAPTRELACQIEVEAKTFGASAGMRACCLYGGAPKGPQLAELRARPQVLVATPGRLNDLLDPPPGLTKAVDVTGVKYLILDEADRMLDMGFEPQIRKIIAGLPEDRLTQMYTATWPVSVRRLASEFLKRDPVEVRIGEVEHLTVNPDITQIVEFCRDALDKESRLEEVLRESEPDQVIVFVGTKRYCDQVAMRIPGSVVIHGDKDQRERDDALHAFKSGNRRVLVATDVAARGLDIKAVRLVVNFDPASREEDYVHRVGRTGRAGLKGKAISLLTNDDGSAGRGIAEVLKRMGLPVPEELERRLASGEMRMGGGGGGGGGGGRSRDPSRSRSVGRRPFGGDDFGSDDRDFGGGRDMFGGGFGGRGRGGDVNMFNNDCPT